MRRVDLEMIEHRDCVAHDMLKAVDVARHRHVGRRIAARGIGDAAVALAEFTQLRFPTAVIATEFMHEQDRRPLPHLLVMQPYFVGRDGERHG